MSFMSKNFDLPENIFYFHNTELDPLTFVLKWDSKDKFYLHLLNRYMGDVIEEPDEHSFVLSVPKNNNYFHRYIPAFDIKYIEDCFELKDYPDPTKYLIQDSCLVNYKKSDIFDCWFHKKKSWINFAPNDTQNKLRRNLSFNKDSYSTGSDEDINSCSASSTKLYSRNKNTRMPYSKTEDSSIVDYIVKNKGAFNVTGTDIWRNMERSNICKIRTWQSMKERYLKHIKYDLTLGCNKYPFLTKEDLKELRRGLKIDTSSDSQKKMCIEKYYNNRRCNSSDENN